MGIIKAHGGKLVNCIENRDKYEKILSNAPKLELSAHSLADVECISTGEILVEAYKK